MESNSKSQWYYIITIIPLLLLIFSSTLTAEHSNGDSLKVGTPSTKTYNETIEKYLLIEYESIRNSADNLYNVLMQFRFLLFTILLGVLAMIGLEKDGRIKNSLVMKMLGLFFFIIIFIYGFDSFLMTQFLHLSKRNQAIQESLQTLPTTKYYSMNEVKIFVDLTVTDPCEKYNQMMYPDKISYPLYLIITLVVGYLIVNYNKDKFWAMIYSENHLKNKIIWWCAQYLMFIIAIPLSLTWYFNSKIHPYMIVVVVIYCIFILFFVLRKVKSD